MFSRRVLAPLAALAFVAAACSPGEPTEASELQERLIEDAGVSADVARCISDELFALASRPEADGVDFDIDVHGFDLQGDIARASSVADMESKVPGITAVIEATSTSCGA